MSSEEAATWILSKYKFENNNWGEVFIIIPHRSWEKSDQIRLAEYYLKNIPFANPRGYESFLSFMSLNNFVNTIQKYLPQNKTKKELLKYYLLPLLNKKANSENDKNTISQLEASL